MDWLEKFSGLIKINVPKLRDIHLFSHNSKVTNVINGNVLQVNIGKLDSEGITALQGLLKQHQENGGIILESKALERLEDFKTVDSSDDTKSLLDYFKGKIASSDLEILRYSIYLKSVFDRGQSVTELKAQLVQRFGERGKNICNLYSAGYFDTQIRPLYQLMFDQPDFSLDRFNQIYELIVTESPFAVFVSRAMSNEELYKEVAKKIETDKKYGIINLNLHGIGEDNVAKINTLLEKLKTENIISEPQEVIRDNKVLSVKLRLNHYTTGVTLFDSADKVLE